MKKYNNQQIIKHLDMEWKRMHPYPLQEEAGYYNYPDEKTEISWKLYNIAFFRDTLNWPYENKTKQIELIKEVYQEFGVPFDDYFVDYDIPSKKN